MQYKMYSIVLSLWQIKLMMMVVILVSLRGRFPAYLHIACEARVSVGSENAKTTEKGGGERRDRERLPANPTVLKNAQSTFDATVNSSPSK